jgi:hypothetical protein
MRLGATPNDGGDTRLPCVSPRIPQGTFALNQVGHIQPLGRDVPTFRKTAPVASARAGNRADREPAAFRESTANVPGRADTTTTRSAAESPHSQCGVAGAQWTKGRVRPPFHSLRTPTVHWACDFFSSTILTNFSFTPQRAFFRLAIGRCFVSRRGVDPRGAITDTTRHATSPHSLVSGPGSRLTASLWR